MKNKDLGLLIIRLSIGLLMIPHGINKLIHAEAFGYIVSLLEKKHLPTFIAYGVFLGEILAPLLVAIGYRTRLAAFVMVGTGCFVLLLAYSEVLLELTPHGGWAPELPALFLFPALALIFTGGGKYAVSTRNKWD